MSERVLDLINKYGRKFVIHVCNEVCSDVDQIEIIREHTFNKDMAHVKNIENVYTISELVQGIQQYDELISQSDEQKYGELRKVFEPLVRSTNWYKSNYIPGTTGSGFVFSFYNGEYIHNEVVQAMFELFLSSNAKDSINVEA